MTGIGRRTLLGVAAGGWAGLGLRPVRAHAGTAGETLVVQLTAGCNEVLKAVAFDPLDKREGSTTTLLVLQSATAFTRMRTEAADPQIDLYQFTGGQERVAATDGLAADLGSVPGYQSIPARFKDPTGRWVYSALNMQGVVYRTDKVAKPPRSYKDLADPQYYGHVAIPTIANGYGTDFLVMMARVHGGGENDVGPGFEAVSALARHSIIFRATSELASLFSDQDVWLVPYDSLSALNLRKGGVPVAFAALEEGTPAIPYGLSMAAKSRNPGLARAAVAALLAPDVQAAVAEQLRLAPTHPAVHLSEELASQLPKPDQLVFLDETIMTQHRPEWTERWNRDVAR